VDILYEDAAVLAVAKPAGLAVIPGRGEKPEDALRARLEAARGEKLWVVHRLDRNTSGVVLLARNEQAHRSLSMAFEARDVAKTYLAWTRGVPGAREGTVALPLHTARKGKMRPAAPWEPDALQSETAYRVERERDTLLGAVARIEVRPLTGRQHQIRVHLRAIGAPLLVDPLYGRCESLAADALGPGSPPVGRLTLHAAAIEVPLAARTIRVEAPLPPDLSALDRWLQS
jgi:RluA family pseudouridine synthase